MDGGREGGKKALVLRLLKTFVMFFAFNWSDNVVVEIYGMTLLPFS